MKMKLTKWLFTQGKSIVRVTAPARRAVGSAFGRLRGKYQGMSRSKKLLLGGTAAVGAAGALYLANREEDDTVIAAAESGENSFAVGSEILTGGVRHLQDSDKLIRAIQMLTSLSRHYENDDYADQYKLNQRAADVVEEFLAYLNSMPFMTGDFISSQLPLVSACYEVGISPEEKFSSAVLSRTLHNVWEDGVGDPEDSALTILGLLATGAPMRVTSFN